MTQPVAEIVTFTLAPNVTPGEFTAISQQSAAFVRSRPGFLHRRLSHGQDGYWTDYVVWSDMAAAQEAMAAFPKQDFAPALTGAIAPDSIIMRHETVLWDMAAA